MSVAFMIALFVFGLIFGSFVNALVWRLRQQLDDNGNPLKLPAKDKLQLSVVRGRSMCVHCKHELSGKDLVPVFSWLMLKGKCRYCHKPISAQYPIIELFTALMFVASYVFWPNIVAGSEWIMLVGFLAALVPLIAMALYDARWYILPSQLIYAATALYGGALVVYLAASGDVERAGWAFAAGGTFWLLFAGIFYASEYLLHKKRISHEWLGGGDVRLAFLLGLLAGTLTGVFIALFVASLLGLMGALIGKVIGGSKIDLFTKIPFGPYLIAGAVFALLWGSRVSAWYESLVIPM